jgi:hypothetical protein
MATIGKYHGIRRVLMAGVLVAAGALTVGIGTASAQTADYSSQFSQPYYSNAPGYYGYARHYQWYRWHQYWRWYHQYYR